MARAFGFLAVLFVIGGVAALFVKEGIYRSHAVDGNVVVVVNRFTGEAFQIKNGLREPVRPSNLENRIARYFDNLSRLTPAATAPADVVVPTGPVLSDEDPFAGMRQSPDFKILSPASQFDRMKRYAAYVLQPARSARLPPSDREKMLNRMLKGLLAHPYAQSMSESEKNDLRQFFHDIVYGRS